MRTHTCINIRLRIQALCASVCTYLPAYLTYLSSFLLYIETYILTYMDTFIGRYRNKYLHADIHKFIHTYIHTYINTYLHTYILTYLLRRFITHSVRMHADVYAYERMQTYIGGVKTACAINAPDVVGDLLFRLLLPLLHRKGSHGNYKSTPCNTCTKKEGTANRKTVSGEANDDDHDDES